MNQKERLQSALESAEKILNALGFIASFYVSDLKVSQIPLIQSQMKEANDLLSGKGSYSLVYANESLVKKSMEALSKDMPPPVKIEKSCDGNFNFRDFKLFIEGEERMHIDGSIEPGQHVVLKGKSGLGKSTMIKALFGQKSSIVETEGAIEIPGISEGENSMLLVSQDVLLSPKQSLLENIVLRDKSSMTEEEILASKERIKDLLGGMDFNNTGNLDDRLESDDFSWVSGGQRKKIGIVRAILQKPKLLILDETFTGMDQESLHLATKALTKNLPDSIIITVDHDGDSNKVGFYDAVLDLNQKPAAMIPYTNDKENNSDANESASHVFAEVAFAEGAHTCHIKSDLNLRAKKIPTAPGCAISMSSDDEGIVIEQKPNESGAEYHLTPGAFVDLSTNAYFSNVTSSQGCAIEVHNHEGHVSLVGVACAC